MHLKNSGNRNAHKKEQNALALNEHGHDVQCVNEKWQLVDKKMET